MPLKSLDDVATLITDGRARQIVVMTGAGISTSAGIPDFRSPETGLYANLQRYNLPFPEAVFELGYFKARPEAFFRLAHELYPGRFQSTLTHHFIAMLEDKGILRRCYSQNIDCLDQQAGLSADKLVEAHGSFASATCLRCKKKYDMEDLRAAIDRQEVTRCERANCKGRKEALIKPDIVFFGEGLPDRFHRLTSSDFRNADLLIVMGTSLSVYPFAGLVELADCPKILLNLEPTPLRSEFDLWVKERTDDAVLKLAGALGWDNELKLLKEAGDEKWQATQSKASVGKKSAGAATTTRSAGDNGKAADASRKATETAANVAAVVQDPTQSAKVEDQKVGQEDDLAGKVANLSFSSTTDSNTGGEAAGKNAKEALKDEGSSAAATSDKTGKKDGRPIQTTTEGKAAL